MITPPSDRVALRDAAPPPHTRARGGFTLLEVLVAVLVLAVGLAALARGSAQALGHLAHARSEGDAAARAARRLDALRALPCAGRVSWDSADAVFTERWTVIVREDSSASELVVRISARDARRRTARARVYASVAPC